MDFNRHHVVRPQIGAVFRCLGIHLCLLLGFACAPFIRAAVPPVLIESITSTNTINSPYWTNLSGTWGKSSNLSKVPSLPPFRAIGCQQTETTNGAPTFLVIATNTTALIPGVTYTVQVTTPSSSTQPPPDDLVVAISTTDVTNSTLPAITQAFAEQGVNKWTTLGQITPSTPNPTMTFALVSGSLSSVPSRRFYAQCVRFIPQDPTNGLRVWNGGAGPADPMWNNPTNWNNTTINLEGDDVELQSPAGGYSIPDGPFRINSLKFSAGAGGFLVGTNFSGPLSITSTNGILNESGNDQFISVAMDQGTVPLTINAGAGALTFSNAMSGTAGYSVAGGGTVYLRNSNSIVGPVSVNGGSTLRISKSSGAGMPEPAGGTSFLLDSATLQNDDTKVGAPLIDAGFALTIGPSGATVNVPISSAQSLVFDGVITNAEGGSAGPFVKTGAGRLTLGGFEANTFNGLTVLNAGRLILNKYTTNALAGDALVSSGLLQSYASEQIADTATVTISGGAWAMADSSVETIASFVLNSGSVTGAMSTVVATNFDLRSGIIAANLAGTGGLTKTTDGAVTFDGTGTFSGEALIQAGTFTLFGTLGNSAVTVSGGTLAGTGYLNGPVHVQSGGKLSPGNPVGQLTLTSSLTLDAGSCTFMEINSAESTNDAVVGLAEVIYGGALVMTNLSGTLTNGNEFQLFSAAAYSGEFASFALPPLPTGSIWKTSRLLVDGTLEVVPQSSTNQPVIGSLQIVDAAVILRGNGGGANIAYRVLASTNVAEPFSNWTPLVTNAFDENGSFQITNTLDPELPAQYLIIEVP